MADEEAFTIELKGLDKLIKALKGNLPQIEVGIIGKNARSGGGSNTEIGAVHEFGAPARGIPQRSFLRMPLSEHLNTYLEDSGAFTEDTLGKVIKEGSVKPWLDKVAVTAQVVILDAFNTSGFGKWPAWKDPNYKNEGGMLLVDTQQLRNSITAQVKE